MSKLEELRQQYPQYHDMSDQQLADAYHDKYYADIPKEQYYSKIGLNQSAPSFLDNAANDVQQHINQPVEALGRSARDMGAGAAQGLLNVGPGLYNLGASGVNALGGNLPKSPMFNFAGDSPSAQVGNVASFFAGPGALRGLGKIPQVAQAVGSASKIPLIANAIKSASNILSKSPAATGIAGNAILGGAYSPDHPLIGMGLGAGAGVAGEGISRGYSGIKNAIGKNEFLQRQFSRVNPAGQAKEIENYLSGGTNNITDNSRELAADIRNAHDMRSDEAGIFFNHALDAAGNENIYGPEYSDPYLTKSSGFHKAQDMIKKIKQFNIGGVFDSFKTNPSFSNAHRLQSELGDEIGKLKSNPLQTPEDRLQLGKIVAAREQLKNDISGFLEKRDQTSNFPLADRYAKGTELYEKNVVPFLGDKKLVDIVKKRKTDINNIHTPFSTPTNSIDKDGVEKIGNINKIMQDLPETSKNRILFNAIGGNKLGPDELLKKLDEIKSKGYGSYFTPELNESMNALNKKLRNKGVINTAAKFGGAGMGFGIIENALSHLFKS